MVYFQMPEHNKPTHDLKTVQSVFSNTQGLHITGTALRDAAALGYGSEGIIETI